MSKEQQENDSQVSGTDDGRLRADAIGHFKDWSNYLLVTTVAALGWVSGNDGVLKDSSLRSPCIWSFVIAVVLGIFTLALIPLVTEQASSQNNRKLSFYQIKVEYRPFKLLGLHSVQISSICVIQHAAFIIGIVLYGAGATCTT